MNVRMRSTTPVYLTLNMTEQTTVKKTLRATKELQPITASWPLLLASQKVVSKRDDMYICYSLVTRPSPAPVFDRLQYVKTEGEGLVNLTT